jgi:hypothetical protein
LPPNTGKRLPSTIAPNVLDRDFRALAPNRRLHLHLDRRGLALPMMAIWRWGKPDALLHHSDQGSQSVHQRAVPVSIGIKVGAD